MTMMRFSVEPPPGAGEPFEARYTKEGGVESNRNGDWEKETRLTLADLMFPEQEFIEWDIRPIKDVKDMNPYHDPETGQFTHAPGIYEGTVTSKNSKGTKNVTKRQIYARSHEDALKRLEDYTRRNRLLKPEDPVKVEGVKLLHPEQPPTEFPEPTPDELEWRREMQERVDEQKGYKGD